MSKANIAEPIVQRRQVFCSCCNKEVSLATRTEHRKRHRARNCQHLNVELSAIADDTITPHLQQSKGMFSVNAAFRSRNQFNSVLVIAISYEESSDQQSPPTDKKISTYDDPPDEFVDCENTLNNRINGNSMVDFDNDNDNNGIDCLDENSDKDFDTAGYFDDDFGTDEDISDFDTADYFDDDFDTDEDISDFDFDRSWELNDTTYSDDELYEAIEMLYWKLENNITDCAFANLPPSKKPRLSLYLMKKWLNRHSGVTSVKYHCCVNSCVAYTGNLRNRNTCPYCSEPRYEQDEKPRKTYTYLPLIPRLVTQYTNFDRSKEFRYRATFPAQREREKCADVDRTAEIMQIYSDIFDGTHYKELVDKGLFQDERDIALGFASDGFQLFQNNHHDCWPILMFNYNIPPQQRVEKRNLILCGIMPGPRQPKDLDTFLQPLLEELLQLQDGIDCFDGFRKDNFQLRAHLLPICGDMPAIAKIGGLKGHNSMCPCRYCEIRGIRPAKSTHYYYPLNKPRDGQDHNRPDIDPYALPRRTHERMMEIGEILHHLDGKEKEHIQKKTGNNLCY